MLSFAARQGDARVVRLLWDWAAKHEVLEQACAITDRHGRKLLEVINEQLGLSSFTVHCESNAHMCFPLLAVRNLRPKDNIECLYVF